MKKYIITLLILLISIVSSASNLNFEAMEDLGGAIILNTEPLHAFHLYQDGDNTYLTLAQKIGRDGNRAIWKVIDYIVVPNYGKDYTLCYVMCNLDGKFAPEIAAIAKYKDEEKYDEILKAWKADLKVGRIIEIDTKGIVCINEGYGA